MTAQHPTESLLLDERRSGVGGSDVAPILGLSPWRSPLAVYLEKRGEDVEPARDSEPMRWGRILEPVLLAEYARRTGREVSVPAEMLRHPVHAHMIAHLDGLTDCGRVVEIKTARTAEGWGEPGSDDIPEPYALQVQHYLLVAGAVVADVAVLFGGSDCELYTLEADRELHGLLIDAEADFWRRVQEGDPPAPQSYQEAAAFWRGRSAAGTVQATPEATAACDELALVREQLKGLGEREDALKLAIAQALGEGGGDTLMEGARTLATWKLAKGAARLDAAALRAEHPEIAAQFTTIGAPSRRLLLRGSKP